MNDSKHGPNIKAWGPEYMAMDDVIEVFGVSRRTLFNRKKDGTLTFVMFEGRNYVHLSALKRYFGEDVVEFKLADRTYNKETGRYEATA